MSDGKSYSFTEVGTLIESFRHEMRIMAEDITSIRSDVNVLKEDVKELKSDMIVVKDALRINIPRITALEAKVR